jgi:hypothetical protein
VERRLELASIDGENQRCVGGLVAADCEVVRAGRGKCHGGEGGGDEGDVETHIDGLRSWKCLKFGSFVWCLRSWKFVAKMMLLMLMLMLRWRLRGNLSGLIEILRYCTRRSSCWKKRVHKSTCSQVLKEYWKGRENVELTPVQEEDHLEVSGEASAPTVAVTILGNSARRKAISVRSDLNETKILV